MSLLPALPVELCYQILSYVVTPKRPVQVESWKDSKPILQFAPVDADVQRSFTLFTGPQATELPFPIFQNDLWRQLVSQSRWLLQRTAYDLDKLIWAHWPYARDAEVPYACDLSRLQSTFQAQMKHVDVVIDAVDYFEDGYFNPKFSCVLGNTNQWAYVSTGQIEAVLETCQGLKSLRLYLDAWRGETSFDHFYESSVFRALWYYTAPECFRDREDNVVKEWKEECKKRGIDFKIIAKDMSDP